MDNENTPQSHRILYPGLNGIRTYADLLMTRSRPLPVPDAEVISTNGRDTLTDTVSQQSQITGSDIVPQQSQMRGPETAPQESQMRGSETVPQESQLRGSDTVLQESQKWYGLIPVRYLRYLHGIVKLCNAKPDLFGLLPTLRTSAFMAVDVDFVTLTSQISYWHPAHLCEQLTELVICRLYLTYGRCSLISLHANCNTRQ